MKISVFFLQINWRPIIGGLILQFTFGLITIRWKTGRDILECVGNKVTAFLNYAQQGATFVYGVEIVEKQKVFAFMVSVKRYSEEILIFL